MESNKYYTPEVEEFYTGFIYEYGVKIEDDILWTSINYSHDLMKSFPESPVLNPNLRVKYLDKEDIESLGFKHEGDKLRSGAIQIYSKNNISLFHESDSNKITIITRDPSKNDFYMKTNMDPHKVNLITIKNKSELKKLLKQLNIK